MSNTELKRCPFCGSEAEIQSLPIGQNKSKYRAVCLKCGIRLKYQGRKYEAIEAWNRRAE